MKILLVENNDEIRSNLKNELEQIGYQCFSTSKGQNGFEIIKSKKIDLVIISYDLPWPDWDGVETAVIIKKNNPQVFIILMTDENLDQDFVFSHGVDKIVNLTNIISCIQKIEEKSYECRRNSQKN